MNGKGNWFQRHTLKDNLMVLGLVVFIITLIASGSWCRNNQNKASTAPSALKVELAKACNDFGRCPLKVILLRGTVMPGSEDSILARIAEIRNNSPDLRTVCFDSEGGDNTAASAISRYISLKGLNTCLARIYETPDGVWQKRDAYCHSMCPWMVIGGRERLVFSNNITVGFHGSAGSWKPCGCQVKSWPLPEVENEFAFLLVQNSNDRKDSPAQMLKHRELLKWSFEQGFTPRTVSRPIKTLLADDDFFTVDQTFTVPKESKTPLQVDAA